MDGAAFAYEKDVKWAYEKEIRVVRLLAEATTIKNGTIHLFPIERWDRISGVILGSKMENDARASDPRFGRYQRLPTLENRPTDGRGGRFTVSGIAAGMRVILIQSVG